MRLLASMLLSLISLLLANTGHVTALPVTVPDPFRRDMEDTTGVFALTGPGPDPSTLGISPYKALAYDLQQFEHTKVRIYLGTDSGIDTKGDQGGNAPGVRLWDGDGVLIGDGRGKQQTPAGGFHEYFIGHKAWDTRRPAYLSVSTWGKDGICISAITVISPDGSKVIWYGDMGAICQNPNNAPRWYDSAAPIGEDLHTPKCIWIDEDGSAGIRHQGFQLHLPDFVPGKGRLKQIQEHPTTYCDSHPRFHMYEKMKVDSEVQVFWPRLKYNHNLSDVDMHAVLVPSFKMAEGEKIEERDEEGESSEFVDGGRRNSSSRSSKAAATKNSPSFNETLTISSYASQSAVRLCEAPNSHGPDFLSLHEKLYCEMSTKTLYPLCEEERKGGICFDVDLEELRGDGPLEGWWPGEGEVFREDAGYQKREGGSGSQGETIKKIKKVVHWG